MPLDRASLNPARIAPPLTQRAEPATGAEDVEDAADLASATEASMDRAMAAIGHARAALRENAKNLRALLDGLRDEREQAAINAVSSDLFRAVGRGSG